MQALTQNLGSYMEHQRVENMQAHMINHVHIRKVEQEVEEMSEVLGYLFLAVVVLAVVIFLLLVFR
jgi:predicted neutral ceramidase superfamily lipid hydrolase